MLGHKMISGLAATAMLVVPGVAQVRAEGSAQASAAVPAGARQVPTQLLGGVSSESGKVGQPVISKLFRPATLADGTMLPAGSQLMGRLTEVKTVSEGKGTSSLKMLFDQARTPDGQVRKIVSSVQSVGKGTVGGAAPRATSNMRSGGTVADGGLLGGVTGLVGGVASTATGLVGTVTGLPGVLLGADGTLSAQGKNVMIPAGTMVTVTISAQ